jgi:hypothetical protein
LYKLSWPNKINPKKKKSHTNSPKDIEKQITITVEEQASIHSYLRITELP